MINTILASSSPRRKEILNLIGVKPVVVKPDVDEDRNPGESIENFIRRVTEDKLQSIFPEKYSGSLIISADTVVVVRGEMVGKPKGVSDAIEILKKLSGNIHDVLTGILIEFSGNRSYSLTKTSVEFNKLTDIEIDYYINRENFIDKAGAYAIQGLASVFIKRIEGCFFNVMGFPVNSFYQLIKQSGISLENIAS